jgi:hypothetical protein
MTGIESVADLVTSEVVGQYIDWAINQRKVRGQSLSSRLVVLKAALGQHPDYRDYDFAWFRLAIDGIPIDEPSESLEKRLAKQVPYSLVESIPEKVNQETRRLRVLTSEELENDPYRHTLYRSGDLAEGSHSGSL